MGAPSRARLALVSVMQCYAAGDCNTRGYGGKLAQVGVGECDDVA